MKKHNKVLLLRNTELVGLNKGTQWVSRKIAEQILIIKKEKI